MELWCSGYTSDRDGVTRYKGIGEKTVFEMKPRGMALDELIHVNDVVRKWTAMGIDRHDPRVSPLPYLGDVCVGDAEPSGIREKN